MADDKLNGIIIRYNSLPKQLRIYFKGKKEHEQWDRITEFLRSDVPDLIELALNR